MANNSSEQESAGRQRHNVSLPAEARERGEKMAAEDIRSFSNFLDWLLDQEWKRRHPDQGQDVGTDVVGKAA